MPLGFVYNALPLMGAHEIVVVDQLIGGAVKSQAQQSYCAQNDGKQLDKTNSHSFLVLKLGKIGNNQRKTNKQGFNHPLSHGNGSGVAEVVDAGKESLIGILKEEAAEEDHGDKIKNTCDRPSHRSHHRPRLSCFLLAGQKWNDADAHNYRTPKPIACRNGNEQIERQSPPMAATVAHDESMEHQLFHTEQGYGKGEQHVLVAHISPKGNCGNETLQIPCLRRATATHQHPCEPLQTEENQGKQNGAYGIEIIKLHDELGHIVGQSTGHAHAFGKIGRGEKKKLILLLKTQGAAIGKHPEEGHYDGEEQGNQH